METESKKRCIEKVEGDVVELQTKKIKSDNNITELAINEEIEKKDVQAVKSKINYSKKKKCVLLLSYCGTGYNGMQRNPGVKTIEEDLTNALFKARAISEDASRNYGKMAFQRCARTDKGVSAARQVVSLKMVPYKELLSHINNNLEPQIRVFALKQVTRGFDCKTRCSSRTYEYLLPTFAFAPTFAHTTRQFRITEEIKNKLNKTLKKYEGTKNFHNFTSGKDFKEESSKRYIIHFQVVDEVFMEKDVEFLVLQVQGQSFMQHQIRKMIGLLIAIMKNYTDADAISRAFQQPKMDIPRAPGLGLVLDQVHFKSYNEKFGQDGFHEPLEWSECENEIKEFKKQFIYSHIIETEINTNSMMRWLNTLGAHSYSNEGMIESQKQKDNGINATAETLKTENCDIRSLNGGNDELSKCNEDVSMETCGNNTLQTNVAQSSDVTDVVLTNKHCSNSSNSSHDKMDGIKKEST